MKLGRRRIVFGASLLICACAFLLWQALYRRPTYEGRTAEQWLQVLCQPINIPDSDPRIPGISGTVSARALAQHLSHEAHTRRAHAETALRVLGTNALPVLLRNLQARDSAVAAKVAALCLRLGIDPTERVVHPERVQQDHRQALLGFRALGPIARPAIPALVRLLKQPEVAERAYEALAQFDDNPVPWLLQVATNASTPPGVRANALFALGNRDKVDARILEVLLGGLKDAHPNVRSQAAGSLWRFPEQAEQIVPVLSGLLDDPSPAVRDSAAVALGELGPAAASAVPVLLKVVETNGLYSAGALALQRMAPQSTNRSAALPRPYELLSIGRWSTPRIQTNRLIIPRLAPAPLLRVPDATTGNPKIDPLTGLPMLNPQ